MVPHVLLKRGKRYEAISPFPHSIATNLKYVLFYAVSLLLFQGALCRANHSAIRRGDCKARFRPLFARFATVPWWLFPYLRGGVVAGGVQRASTPSLIQQSGDVNHAPSEASSLPSIKSGRRKTFFLWDN